MGSIRDGPRIVEEEEDRISSLPGDIIHRILSFLDLKYGAQFCTLSRKWENIWTLMPELNLNSQLFHNVPQFVKFVDHALTRRDSHTQVSLVDLAFTGVVTERVVKSILNYAYSHNVKELTVTCFYQSMNKFPQYIFSSHTLRYLTLNNQARDNRKFRVPNSTWDFPALETLNLENIRIGYGYEKSLDLFSMCVNLKDITLHKCYMHSVESFSICAPQLHNLTVTDTVAFPKIFNVVAPLLKNLTATVISRHGGLPSDFNFLRLSTKSFSSLEKVILSTSKGNYKNDKLVRQLLKLFHVVRSAKLLILDVDIIKCLSSCLGQLSHVPCPFDNLKYLKINTARLEQNEPIPIKSTQVKSYLLENSPKATFIMDLPQVPHKRLRQQVADDTVPMKVAKLEEKIQIRDQLILNLKTDLQMKDQVIANKNANIQMKDEVIADQNTNIQMNDQVIANQNENIQMKDQIIANQNKNIQMKDKVIAKQKAMIQMLKSNNFNMQSAVPATPSVP